MAMLVVLAVHYVEECFLDCLGDRPGLACADRAAVELADRRHLGRSTGKEAFVGNVDVVARQPLRPDPVAEPFGQIDYRGAGDDGEIGGVQCLSDTSSVEI